MFQRALEPPQDPPLLSWVFDDNCGITFVLLLISHKTQKVYYGSQRRMVSMFNFFVFLKFVFFFALLLLYVNWCTMWRLYTRCSGSRNIKEKTCAIQTK